MNILFDLSNNIEVKTWPIVTPSSANDVWEYWFWLWTSVFDMRNQVYRVILFIFYGGYPFRNVLIRCGCYSRRVKRQTIVVMETILLALEDTFFLRIKASYLLINKLYCLQYHVFIIFIMNLSRDIDEQNELTQKKKLNIRLFIFNTFFDTLIRNWPKFWISQ